MSIKVMTRVWESKLESHRKLLCLCLADFGDDSGGNIFPKVSTIAERTTVSERTAQRILHDLVKIGIIRQVGKTAVGTIRYQINLEAVATYVPENKNTADFDGGDKLSPRESGSGIPDMSPPGCQKQHPGVTPVTFGGDTAMSPEPLINLQINHQESINAGNINFFGSSEKIEIIQVIRELPGWSAERLLTVVKGQLKCEINKTSYAYYVRDMSTPGFFWRDKSDTDGGDGHFVLIVMAANSIAADWASIRLKTVIERSVYGITGGIVPKVIIVQRENTP